MCNNRRVPLVRPTRRPVFMLLAALTLVVAALAVTRLLPPPPLARPDLILDRLFTAYGNQGGHWTGGDRTASVALPDGRIVWLFSDTFLGPVNPDHSRPGTAPFVHNSMVVERDGKLGPTLTSGTAARPGSLVNVPGGIGLLVLRGVWYLLHRGFTPSTPKPLT